MNPFTSDSPPSRIAPSVSSPSLLAREPKAKTSSSSTRQGVRPFLLRSTTPLAPPKQPEPPTRTKVEPKEQPKLSRSKTESALLNASQKPRQSTSTSSKLPSAPPLPPANPRQSSRHSSSSASNKHAPIRASRKITFVPDPSPPSLPCTRRTTSSKPPLPPLPRTTAVERVQAVEKRKMELKRESLSLRNNRSDPLRSGTSTTTTGSENVPPQEENTSRRWSLRPVRDPLPRRAISNKDLAGTAPAKSPNPPDSPSPGPSLTRPTPSIPRSALSRGLSIRGPVEVGGDKKEATTSRLSKKESYVGLGRAPPPVIVDDTEESQTEIQESTKMQRSNTGYTSLQEILAERGYQDTRVLTPNSKARAKEPLVVAPTNSIEPTSLLSAPRAQVKEKTSMLSLRGLFSLWGPSNEEPEEEGITGEEKATEGGDEPPSPSGSGGTFTHSPISRAREWVQGVAIATAQESDRTSSTNNDSSTSFTPPPFQYSLSTTEDSPVSSRSYSSSIVTASSIRSPPQVTIALPCPRVSTIALSPISFHRFDTTTTTLSPPTKSNAIKSLRHVVSDSTLPQLLPHYTSFPFSPSSLDSNSSSFADPTINSHLLSPDPVSNAQSTAASTTPSWFPTSTSLRHRASQVFSLPSVGLGLTSSTTPLFPLQQTLHNLNNQQSGLAKNRRGGEVGKGRKPKLLRKAVSSAGLVRPVLTTTNY